MFDRVKKYLITSQRGASIVQILIVAGVISAAASQIVILINSSAKSEKKFAKQRLVYEIEKMINNTLLDEKACFNTLVAPGPYNAVTGPATPPEEIYDGNNELIFVAGAKYGIGANQVGIKSFNISGLTAGMGITSPDKAILSVTFVASDPSLAIASTPAMSRSKIEIDVMVNASNEIISCSSATSAANENINRQLCTSLGGTYNDSTFHCSNLNIVDNGGGTAVTTRGDVLVDAIPTPTPPPSGTPISVPNSQIDVTGNITTNTGSINATAGNFVIANNVTVNNSITVTGDISARQVNANTSMQLAGNDVAKQDWVTAVLTGTTAEFSSAEKNQMVANLMANTGNAEDHVLTLKDAITSHFETSGLATSTLNCDPGHIQKLTYDQTNMRFNVTCINDEDCSVNGTCTQVHASTNLCIGANCRSQWQAISPSNNCISVTWVSGVGAFCPGGRVMVGYQADCGGPSSWADCIWCCNIK